MAAELEGWRSRPLDQIYAVMFVDCIYVKVREGSVANRPIYVAIGVNLAGERDVLGLWAGTGGEGAKHWMAVLSELKARGVADVLILCCDGLKGLPESVGEVWPRTTVQTCVVHRSCKESTRWFYVSGYVFGSCGYRRMCVLSSG